MGTPIPFTPPHVSVNRVHIVDLPGIAVDPQVRDRKAYELLSSRALTNYARELADELDLPAVYHHDSVRTQVELAQYVDFCLQSTQVSVREAAESIGQRLGRNLGYILVALHRGDLVNREARSDWSDADWERWRTIETIWLGGGLMSGQLGTLILQTAVGLLEEWGYTDRFRIVRADFGGDVALLGAARFLPPGIEQSLCLDLGQTLVKRACVHLESGSLTRLESFSPLPVDWDRLGVPSHPDPRRGRLVFDFVTDAIVQTWEESRNHGNSPGTEIMISVAAYVQKGRLLGNGIYAQMHAVAEDVRPFLEEQVQVRLGVRINPRFIHDGTAAAALYAGERNSAVMMVGTALGIGFPPVDTEDLRPLALT